MVWVSLCRWDSETLVESLLHLYTGLSMHQGTDISIHIFRLLLSYFSPCHESPRSTAKLMRVNFRFIEGHAILIGLLLMSFGLTSFMITYYRSENARRDKLARDGNLLPEHYTDEMRWAEREKGDDAFSWRYTI